MRSHPLLTLVAAYVLFCAAATGLFCGMNVGMWDDPNFAQVLEGCAFWLIARAHR